MLSNLPVVIAKTALAVVLAYLVSRELTPDDTLSAAFVAMLCIMPTVFAGLRQGAVQLGASAIGGLATLAVMLPFGMNAATLGVSMVLGLGASYFFGYASTSVVAGFTVMYVGLIGRGGLELYLVRLASVLLGVVTGAVVNLVVSAFWYPRIFGRRVSIAASAVARPLGLLADAVASGDLAALRRADQAFGPVFRLLDGLDAEFGDLRRELRLRRDLRGERLRLVLQQERMVERLEVVAHYGRDAALLLRELLDGPEGRGDAASIDTAGALREVAAALRACAARLAGDRDAPAPALPARFDPLLRHAAARVAEGAGGDERLERLLALLVDLDNLYGAATRLLALAAELPAKAPPAAGAGHVASPRASG